MVTRAGPISRAVASAVKAAQLKPQDVAAVAVVKRYATLIDDAERLADEAEALVGELDPEDVDAYKRLATLATAVKAQTVASDLGPKLLAALTALGMTIAGRGAKGGSDGPRAGSTKLDELRARRTARADRAASVDASAP